MVIVINSEIHVDVKARQAKQKAIVYCQNNKMYFKGHC